jgi:hypothetical protein
MYSCTSTYDFPTYNPIKLTPIRLTLLIFRQWLRTQAQDTSDHSSGIFCQAKSLPKSQITQGLLSEFSEVLEMLDFDNMLI